MKTEKTVEVTPWFPCNIKPVHKGWYECDYGKGNDPCMRFWDGEAWHMEIEGDMRVVYHFGREIEHCWRGLAKPADQSEPVVAEPEVDPRQQELAFSEEDDEL